MDNIQKPAKLLDSLLSEVTHESRLRETSQGPIGKMTLHVIIYTLFIYFRQCSVVSRDLEECEGGARHEDATDSGDLSPVHLGPTVT